MTFFASRRVVAVDYRLFLEAAYLTDHHYLSWLTEAGSSLRTLVLIMAVGNISCQADRQTSPDDDGDMSDPQLRLGGEGPPDDTITRFEAATMTRIVGYDEPQILRLMDRQWQSQRLNWHWDPLSPAVATSYVRPLPACPSCGKSRCFECGP